MAPALPNAHAAAALLLTALALVLFARGQYRLELTSLGLLSVLTVGFSVFPFVSADGAALDPASFFAGFGHQALIAVCALMVVGQGLVHTGALEPVGRVLARAWGAMPFLSFGLTLLVSAVLSAFVNNTPIVVLLLPILVSVCLRTATSPAAVLMPMGFATLIGGTATTIGTSTNLLVVSVAADLGVARFGMFDFVVPAAAAGLVAILYLWLIAPRLLPARDIGLDNVSPRVFDARLQLTDRSPAAGRTLAEAANLAGGMRVTGIRRDEVMVQPLPDVVLRAGDRLRLRDTPQNLKGYESALQAQLYSGDHRVDDDHPLRAENQQLAELVVAPGSRLDGANLRYAQFLDRYALAVLALHRAGKDIWRPHEEIHDVTLLPGDVLLVQGPREQLHHIKQDAGFLVLDATIDLAHSDKAPLALAILVAVVALAALGVMPIVVSATAGAALMLLTRCLGVGAAIRAISPAVFFVVVASLALGRALVDTGAAGYVTDLFLLLTAGASPTVILSALMLLLAVLTNVVSNNAAAVIGTPIAVSIAQQLGLPPEPFVLAVLFGANMSYATPMAYQTNLLVMNAGNYRFAEFLRVGIPLTLLMWLVLTWLLSALYL